MRKSDAVFFLTGAAALVYETVWIRLLARLLGADAAALSVVLAVFMGGMGLGAALLAGAVRRARRPERLFAALELGLAAWAAASPWLLGLLEPVDGGPARALVAAALLLPPTVAMGATFPLMGRITIARDDELGRETSAFYGANTLGAAAGALLGPFALMPALGLSGALFAAAALDVVAAALCWTLLAGRAPRAPAAPRAASAAPAARALVWPAAALALGFTGLALEVVAARLLVTVTGASVYAWAILLAVFLLGIGLGSRQLAGRDRSGPEAGAALFHAALLIAPLALAGLLALRAQLGEADLFGSLSNRMPGGRGVLALWASHALFAGLALLPPALALGAALPAAAAAFAGARPDLSRERALGLVYAANTAGALLGSLAAGFVLLPRAGPRAALALVLALPLCVALALPARRVGRALAGLALSLALGGLLLTPRRAPGAAETVLQLHGVNATVTVEDGREDGGAAVRALRVNGKVVATTAPVDLRLQRLLAHVPAALHGDVREALVIGLGTGMTAGALLDAPTLARLDVFEISDVVVTAAQSFAEWNGGVVGDPRVHLRVADGRHALARAERRWDLVTSDPIHPWTRGSSDLYSLEHFRQMAAHLAPGGVASQWLPLYQLSLEDVRTVVATWCAAFPRVSAWLTAYDLALVGAHDALPFEGRLDQAALPPAMAAHLAAAGVRGALDLAALQVAGDAELRAFAAGAAPMRDDRPVLEFRAPRSFLAGYSVAALRWAGRPEYVAALPAPARPRARELRARLAEFLDALPGGLSAAAAAYGRALFAPPGGR